MSRSDPNSGQLWGSLLLSRFLCFSTVARRRTLEESLSHLLAVRQTVTIAVDCENSKLTYFVNGERQVVSPTCKAFGYDRVQLESDGDMSITTDFAIKGAAHLRIKNVHLV